MLDEDGGVSEMECEFSAGGEPYACLHVPEGSDRGAIVQELYDATIKSMESREREWLQRTQDPVSPPVDSPRPDPWPSLEPGPVEAVFSDDDDDDVAEDDDDDGFVVSDSDEDPELLERQMAGLSKPLSHPYSEGATAHTVQAVANRRNLAKSRVHLGPSKPQASHGRRRRLSSSSSPDESESSRLAVDSPKPVADPGGQPSAAEGEPVAAAGKAPSRTSGSFANWQRTGYLRWRVDGRVGAVVERDEGKTTMADWWAGSSTPSPTKSLASYSLTAAERAHLLRDDLEPWLVERLETALGIRLPPRPKRRRHSKGTIVELMTCGTNHLGCLHQDCKARDWTETELFEKHFFSKSFARIVAEDCFRLRTLQLDYDVLLVWTCAYADLVGEPESDAAAFSKTFTMAPSKFPLRAALTEAQVRSTHTRTHTLVLLFSTQIVDGIVSGRVDGLVTCDVSIPHHLRE